MPVAIMNEHDEKFDRKAQEALLKKVRSVASPSCGCLQAAARLPPHCALSPCCA